MEYLKILKPCVGLLLRIISGFFYSVSAVMIRLGSNIIHPCMFVIIRSILTCVILIPYIVYKKYSFSGETRRNLLVLIGSLTLTIALTILQNYSFLLLHLGDANAILATVTVQVAMIDSIIKCKRCPVYDVFAIILCTIGAVLCTRPTFLFDTASFTSEYYIGFAICFTCSFIWTIDYIVLDQMEELPVSTLMVWIALVALAPNMIILFLTDNFYIPTDIVSISLLIGYSVTSLLSMIILVIGIYFDSSLKVVIGKTLDIIFSMIFDYFYFSFFIYSTSYIGAGLIIIVGPYSSKLWKESHYNTIQ